jgi:CTP:molybdopterin cytidylyltransferase MocA
MVYEGKGYIDSYITTETIAEAAALINFELKVNDDFRNGMIASIESALRETYNEDGHQLMSDREIAEHIMNRIYDLDD